MHGHTHTHTCTHSGVGKAVRTRACTRALFSLGGSFRLIPFSFRLKGLIKREGWICAKRAQRAHSGETVTLEAGTPVGRFEKSCFARRIGRFRCFRETRARSETCSVSGAASRKFSLKDKSIREIRKEEASLFLLVSTEKTPSLGKDFDTSLPIFSFRDERRAREIPPSLSLGSWLEKQSSFDQIPRRRGFSFLSFPSPFPSRVHQTYVRPPLRRSPGKIEPSTDFPFYFPFLFFFLPFFFLLSETEYLLISRVLEIQRGVSQCLPVPCARKTRVGRDAGFTCHGLWINFDFRRAGARLRLANGAGERGWFSTRYTVHICMYFVRNFSSFANN